MRALLVVLICGFGFGCVPADMDVAVPPATILSVTDAGAGAVRSDTRYDVASLEAAIPGSSVRPIETARENGTTSTLAAFVDGIQVVQIFRGGGGTVGEIHGVTHHLVGPNGERIGEPFRRTGLDRDRCRVGRNLWRGMAVCPARGSEHVTLVFSIPGYDGPFDELPEAGDLAGAELQRIVWHADT